MKSWIVNGAGRAAGLLWFSAWGVVLLAVHRPWLELGGLVPEWVRYWERVGLAGAIIIGWAVGDTVREAARPGSGRSHASLVRVVLLLPAGAVAAMLVLQRLVGAEDWVGVTFNAFLGYWAGLDAGVGAWPLLSGRHYSLFGAIDDEDDVPPEAFDPRFR